MALPSEVLRFGEWLPDLPELDNPGLVLVQNAIPESVVSYGQIRAPEYRGNAMDNRVLAGHWTIAGSGNTTAVFAGTTTNLYRQGADLDWDVVSQSGGYSDIERWDMTSFGNRILAVNGSDAIQAYDVGTDTLFDDISGAPVASTIGLVRDFVVIGNVDGLGENFVQWSGYNNSALWTPSRSTQSGYQPLASDGGRVQAIVEGSEGYVFLENSIYRMTYIGPPRIFQFDEIAPGRGTLAPKSVVRIGQDVFFYDPAGFYRMDLRSLKFTPIGQDKVDQWFTNSVPTSSVVDLQASVDAKRKFVAWSFSNDSSAVHNNHILIYQYELRRWALLVIDHDSISLLPSPSASLDDLGTLLPGGIDDDSISVDSDLYSSGELEFGVFGSNHKGGTLTGDPLPAKFTTAEIGVTMNNFIFTNLQRPYITRGDDTTGSLTVNHRDDLFDPRIGTPPAAITPRGRTEATIRSRYQQYCLSVNGGFEKVFGLEVFRRVE